MAPFALTDAFVYFDSHDFTGDTNKVMLDMVAADLDSTTFRSRGWKESTAGVKTVTFEEEGFWSATGSASNTAMDSSAWFQLGLPRVFTMGPIETETSVAYLWRAGEFHYEPMTGSHGDLAGFLLRSVGTDGVGVIRGKLAVEIATVTSTGAKGSGVNIATTSDSGFVYASLHTFAAGTSYSAVVESATESSFASPTTQGTFSDITSIGGSWMTRVAATNGQNWYRFRVTGISGSFTIAGAIGVQ